MSILDLLKEVPLSAVLKEKIAALEAENKALKAENAVLKEKLAQSEEQRRALEKKIAEELSHKNSNGRVCDHCASQQLRRTGSRPDPIFGKLGVKQEIFVCESCGKESAFTP
jgi:hypothetical protein